MSYTVVGLFTNRNQAQAAIRELTERRFVSENIDISNRTSVGNATNGAREEVIVTDSVANFFHSLFSSDKKNANNYTSAAGDADAIVTVHVDDEERAREAAFVLDKNGAIDVDSNSTDRKRQNFTQSQEQFGAAQNVPQTQGETTIPIIEEQLRVDKKVIETGGVRLKSRIVERPIEESVRLRNQYVIVNRRSVDREVSTEDLSNFREGEIEFLELAEVPVISKRARVVEEIEIGRQVSEHQEVVHETLKRNDVEVEDLNKDVEINRDGMPNNVNGLNNS